MIKLRDVALTPVTQGHLDTRQADVNGKDNYAAKVGRAKQLWDGKSGSNNGRSCFEEVKGTLEDLCQGARRCAYCEDSLADEVEHIKPKNLYPEEAFCWSNYLYACGPCNGFKNDKFSVIPPGSEAVVSVRRARNAPVLPPLEGDPVFIDPRREDPTKFLRIDVLGTFLMMPLGEEDSAGADERRRYRRANQTISDLNLEEGTAGHLTEARRQAFNNFRARLLEIVTAAEADKDVTRAISEFKRLDHWSVWLEIKRSRRGLKVFRGLFARFPDALNW